MSIDLQVPPAVEVPVAPAVPSTASKRRRIIVIAAAAIIGTMAFATIQTVTLSGVKEDLAASQNTVTDLKAENSDLQADLGNAQASVDSLESEVSAQDAQLAACSQANLLALKSDKAFHDAVEQIVPAAFGGSNYAFDSALARYRSLSRQWAVAANQCEPGAGYTFG